MLLPALSRAKVKGQRLHCSNNVRQLTVAWMMYAADNGGRLCLSSPPDAMFRGGGWVYGDIRANASPFPVVPDAIATTNITEGRIYPYVKSLPVYRDPSDPNKYKDTPSIRSYSMNAFLGERFSSTRVPSTTPDTYPLFYARDTDIKYPTRIFVFVEEDHRFINDARFVVDPETNSWIEIPHRHGSKYTLSFADGHVASFTMESDPQPKTQTSSRSLTELAPLAAAAAIKK